MNSDIAAPRSEVVSHDQLRAAAAALGVPWDREALRPDGTRYWEPPALPHILNTTHAISCEQDGVILFYDADGGTIEGMPDHPVWETYAEVSR